MMKMSENIVILKWDTKNILRKFSKMKKRISSLKRCIITNESQLKRFLFFFFLHFLIFSFIFFFICLISSHHYHHYHFIYFFFHHHIYLFFHHHICSSSQFIWVFSLFRSLVNSFARVSFVERVDRFRV